MKAGGASLVVAALEDEGVRCAFGIPGTHTIELYDALVGSDVRPIAVTDERSAAFMADAFWRAGGELACIAVVPGAGVAHALAGIAEAWMDQAAMVVLAAGVRGDTGHAFQLHDIDQRAMVGPVVKAAYRVDRGADLYARVREACRVARAAPAGPVFVEIPADLFLFQHTASGAEPFEPPPLPASRADLEAAVAHLGRCRRPLLYLGRGAAGAGEHLVALAERLESPVATTFQGKGVFPERHPLWLWPGFGPAAPQPLRRVAASCDGTLAIGCRFGEVATGSYGRRPPVPLVHVDADPEALNRNYHAELAVTADAAAFVQALLECLPARAPDEDLRTRIADAHRAVARESAEMPSSSAVSPGRLLAALQRVFGPDTIFTTDSGNGTFLAVEGLRLDRRGALLSPVDFSCMGYAVPAAIGAALACPERPVVALAGDGAFLMTGLELLTARVTGRGLVVVLLRDRELAQIAQFQETALGRKVCSAVPDYDVAALAAAVGARSLSLPSDEVLEDVLEDASSLAGAGETVLVDARVDYTRRTYFTRGVVRTNLGRLPWADRLRFVARALGRRATRWGQVPAGRT